MQLILTYRLMGMELSFEVADVLIELLALFIERLLVSLERLAVLFEFKCLCKTSSLSEGCI